MFLHRGGKQTTLKYDLKILQIISAISISLMEKEYDTKLLRSQKLSRVENIIFILDKKQQKQL